MIYQHDIINVGQPTKVGNMFDSLTGKFNTNKCNGLKETFYGVTNYQTESGALNIKCSVYIYIYVAPILRVPFWF